MEETIKFKPSLLSGAVLLSLLCHSLIFSIFHLSFKKSSFPENPYFISLGAIIPRDDFSALDNPNIKNSGFQIIKSNLRVSKSLDDLSKKTQLTKPPNNIPSSNEKNNTFKTIFFVNDKPKNPLKDFQINNDFESDSYKPLRLP